MISKGFIRNSAIYTVAGILPMASAVILLPFYLSYLPIEQYGALAFYLAFSMLVQVISTYSFDSSLYIYYHDYKNDNGKLSVLISSAYVFMIFLGLGLLIILTLTGTLLFDLVSGDKGLSFFPYGFLSVLTAVFQSFFKVHSSLLQTREKPETFFWANLISFSLIASLSIGGLIIYPEELVGPIGGRACAALIAGSWALIRIFSAFGVHFDFHFLKTTFRINNSSFIYQLQQWFINYFDRVLITLYLTMEDVGSYDFAWKCLLVIDLIIGGLYNSFYPKVISALADQEQKQTTQSINRYYHGLTAAVMLLVSVAIFMFPLLQHLRLMKPEYEESLRYIPYMGLIYLIRGMRYYFSLPYGAIKWTKPLPVIYLLISSIKIGLMLLFIRQYGVMAVIGASLLSSVVEVVFLRFSIKHKFHFQFNKLKIIAAPLILGVTILISESAINFNKDVLHGLYLAFCILILSWLYRNELKLIITSKSKNNA
jgi:O-antigen/teichoic acid export membrane protein